jgi:signal transduction histidine kinase
MESVARTTFHAPPDRCTPTEIERQRRLLMSDENLCTVLDAMPELVMVLNRNRQIVFGNRALAAFAEAQNCGTFVGMRPGELLACEHASAAPAGCGTAEACSSCGAVETILAALAGDKASHECRILRESPNGVEALDLKVWGTPFRWEGESLALVVAVDISSDKRRQVLEKIFFHDILNTAGVINSLVELLMDGMLSLDEVKDSLHETAQALIGEIRSQRELLAAENNELSVTITPLLSQTILDSVVKAYEKHPAAREKQIIFDPAHCCFTFTSDERLLSRVLGNLIKNALEASLPGQRVTLGCTASEKEISFWCHNEGFIPRPVQLQIFQRSFSTKEPGRGTGTYSIRLLSERYLKGRVTFVSTPEAGTTFTATYPREYPAAGEPRRRRLS